jgi:hypothetical protein
LGFSAGLADDEKLLFCVDLSHYGSICTKLSLGKSIHQKKVPILTSQLRQRLEMSEAELDFTPASLERLEDKLFELLQKIDIQTLTDEDIVQFVREISAYFGKVLVVHAEGNWEPYWAP